MTTTLRSLLIGSAAFLFLPVSTADDPIQDRHLHEPAERVPGAVREHPERCQASILIRADEMQAAGMYEGTIESIGFDVFSPTGAVLRVFSCVWEPPPRVRSVPTGSPGSPRWDPPTTTDAAGWNDHVLDIPLSGTASRTW